MKRVLLVTTCLLASLALLAGCERPPMETQQLGYRGTGMEGVANPRLQQEKVAELDIPEAPPPAPDVGPRAGDVYENVEVLGDLSVAQFARVMQAITAWVSPEQGCNYCHVGNNFAAEDLYTKTVSRNMILMTRYINQKWEAHVAPAGVTCYTCHKGLNVPEYIWFNGDSKGKPAFVGNKMDQNTPMVKTAYASLPNDMFDYYLSDDREISVVADTALPERYDSQYGIKRTERTYSLMMHMSQSLGVNCTHCHNSRSFYDWNQSSPLRAKAWYGIRMVRGMIDRYLDPLQPVYPDYRLGAQGDAPKANCATCHGGLQKPLNGYNMLADYPSLSEGIIRDASISAVNPEDPHRVDEPQSETTVAAITAAENATQ